MDLKPKPTYVGRICTFKEHLLPPIDLHRIIHVKNKCRIGSLQRHLHHHSLRKMNIKIHLRSQSEWNNSCLLPISADMSSTALKHSQNL